MTKISNNKRALVLGLGLFIASICIPYTSLAQQFGGAISVPASSDAVSGMMERASSVPATAGRTESARQLAINFVNSAVDAGMLDAGMGWNDQREIFVATGVANYPVSNPTVDPNFGQARALKSLEASLEAKKSIIEYVRMELDFSAVVSLPETGLGTDFDMRRAELEYEIEMAMFDYHGALKEFGHAEVDNFQGITLGDLVKEGMVSFIKSKLNPDFDVSRLEQEKRERLDAAQNNLTGFQSRLDQLTTEAAAMRGQIQQSQGFDVETYAALTVVGAMMVGQFESWIDGNYEIASVYMWSPVQEKQVRNILAGKDSTGKPGRLSIGQYMRNTDWSSAIGGRKFVDDNGAMHVVGIGAWPMRGNSSAQRRASEGFALRMAQSQVALAFSGDVESQSRAQAKMDEIATGAVNGEIESAFAESFSQELSESTQMTLQGVQTRYSNVVRHPISGQEMHVVVVSASASQTSAAKKMEEVLFRSAGEIAGLQQFSRGTRAGLEDQLGRERSDSRSFEQGRAEVGAPPSRSTGSSVPAVRDAAAPVSPGQPASVTGAGSDVEAFGW